MDEFTESTQAVQHCDSYGRWVPAAQAGNYARRSGGSSLGGVTGKWWYCDGLNIHSILWNPPEGTFPYKTFSTIYNEGDGFWVLNGDATNPPNSDSWHPLWFDWDDTTLASTLTNAGTQARLRVQDMNARWPRMLLPDIYHGPHYAAQGFGGLRGDLPIFLSLLAFSMKPERLSTELPRLMEQGLWKTHPHLHGRKFYPSFVARSLIAEKNTGADKRGVIVYVYAYNGNDADIRALEDGTRGNYYV